MLNKIVNADREGVREQALNLLFGKMSEGRTYRTTEETRYSVSYGANHTLKDRATGNYEREEELYSLITNEETGAKVLYFHVPTTKEDYYRVVYFAPEEWERYTLPFRNLPEETIYIAVLLNACFVKPVIALSPDEALTPDFANELNAYFGSENWTYRTKEEYVISKYLSMDALSLLQRDQLREIAKGTNTPLSLILKASKKSIWDF